MDHGSTAVREKCELESERCALYMNRPDVVRGRGLLPVHRGVHATCHKAWNYFFFPGFSCALRRLSFLF